MSVWKPKELEADIEGDFVKWCEGRGHVSLKLKIEGKRGWPDQTVFLKNGVVAVVELKRPGGKLSKQQIDWIHDLYHLNHHAAAFDTLAEACDFIKGLE